MDNTTAIEKVGSASATKAIQTSEGTDKEQNLRIYALPIALKASNPDSNNNTEGPLPILDQPPLLGSNVTIGCTPRLPPQVRIHDRLDISISVPSHEPEVPIDIEANTSESDKSSFLISESAIPDNFDLLSEMSLINLNGMSDSFATPSLKDVDQVPCSEIPSITATIEQIEPEQLLPDLERPPHNPSAICIPSTIRLSADKERMRINATPEFLGTSTSVVAKDKDSDGPSDQDKGALKVIPASATVLGAQGCYGEFPKKNYSVVVPQLSSELSATFNSSEDTRKNAAISTPAKSRQAATLDSSPLDRILANQPIQELPPEIPIVTTYADATNLAARFPKYANELLTRPLSASSNKVREKNDALIPTVIGLSTAAPPVHSPSKPNWAVAPLEEEEIPISRSGRSNRAETSKVHPRRVSRTLRKNGRNGPQLSAHAMGNSKEQLESQRTIPTGAQPDRNYNDNLVQAPHRFMAERPLVLNSYHLQESGDYLGVTRTRLASDAHHNQVPQAMALEMQSTNAPYNSYKSVSACDTQVIQLCGNSMEQNTPDSTSAFATFAQNDTLTKRNASDLRTSLFNQKPSQNLSPDEDYNDIEELTLSHVSSQRQARIILREVFRPADSYPSGGGSNPDVNNAQKVRKQQMVEISAVAREHIEGSLKNRPSCTSSTRIEISTKNPHCDDETEEQKFHRRAGELYAETFRRLTAPEKSVGLSEQRNPAAIGRIQGSGGAPLPDIHLRNNNIDPITPRSSDVPKGASTNSYGFFIDSKAHSPQVNTLLVSHQNDAHPQATSFELGFTSANDWLLPARTKSAPRNIVASIETVHTHMQRCSISLKTPEPPISWPTTESLNALQPFILDPVTRDPIADWSPIPGISTMDLVPYIAPSNLVRARVQSHALPPNVQSQCSLASKPEDHSSIHGTHGS